MEILKYYAFCLQNTIASLETLIPILEAAFTAARIGERGSWRLVGESLLARLEGETEAVRQEYLASQLQLPAAQQPKPAAISRPARTDQHILEQALKKALESAQQLSVGSRNPQETAKGRQEPQGADEDDAVHVEEVEKGAAGSKGSAALSPWNGWDWTGDVV